MDAALAALIGAAIGAVASLGGAWIQQRHQTARERVKMATELGVTDHRLAGSSGHSTRSGNPSCFVMSRSADR